MTVVFDLINSTVEHVADERKAESLEAYYLWFTREQLEKGVTKASIAIS